MELEPHKVAQSKGLDESFLKPFYLRFQLNSEQSYFQNKNLKIWSFPGFSRSSGFISVRLFVLCTFVRTVKCTYVAKMSNTLYKTKKYVVQKFCTFGYSETQLCTFCTFFVRFGYFRPKTIVGKLAFSSVPAAYILRAAQNVEK